ncbi:MAG TPA: carboxypeptidase regulatory-like domain-containing protein [Verrucomicrobiae bacterium]|jgi:plastocyanin|nr:carboxypeptidase regulatory-like domain-containing protein [Verrucomicrobiae bacterium]
MKTRLLNLILGLTVVAANAEAGTIMGRVRAEGKAGADQDALCSAGHYDSRAYKFAQRLDYSAMHEFVVYIEGPVGTNGVIATSKPVEVVTKKVAQHKAMFYPHVIPVVKGTVVEWPNDDDIFHNVFSFSEIQPFDLGLYKGHEAKSVTFNTPGRVDVFCSIHSSMNCVVLVLENPYFASTDEKGRYLIQNIPAGTCKLKAWHERLPSQHKEIVVPENGEVKVDFTLGIEGLPKF